jgi:hypothetical protein
MHRITVETDLFEHQQVQPHFINPCCFGEDFAAWLKAGLSNDPSFPFQLSDPKQEDYGWGLQASSGRDRFWIALSYVGDGPQAGPVRWVISVAHEPGLNLARRLIVGPGSDLIDALQDSIHQLLKANRNIKLLDDI